MNIGNISRKAHDRRVSELLAANTAIREELRKVEQKLRFLWTQERVTAFVIEKGFPRTVQSRLNKLEEELRELFEAFRAADEEGVRLESADVAIVLMDLASVAGFDLMLAIQEKMAVNRERDWTKRAADRKR